MTFQTKPRKGLKRTGFKSAFVRHSPFKPQNGFKRKVAVQGSDEQSEASEATVGQKGAISRGSGLRPVGKKGRAWITARSWLKKQFNWLGLTHCMMRFQGCFYDDQLGFAHPAKRRNLKEGELYVAVPVCNPCHSQLEIMPPEKMRELVEAAWAKAGITLPQNS